MGYLTVSDYVLEAQTKLQQLAQSNSIQLSSIGSLGMILTMLGNTQYNHKLLHDSQMLNTNILTATNDKNLLYLGGLQGYKRKFAIPATLNGNILFASFISSSQLPTGINSRKITITNPNITVKGISFKSNNIYTITIFKYNSTLLYSLDILSKGITYSYDVDNYGKTLNNDDVPIFNTLQYESLTVTLNIPYYDVDSTYTKTIRLNSKQIYSYNIMVNGVPYTLASDKIGYNGNSNVIFYSYDVNNDIILEFGNGTFGKYLSNTAIIVTLNLTLGTKGNIGSSIDGILSSDSIIVKDYDINNVLKSTFSKNISDLISYNVVSSTNGTDVLKQESLRKDIIKFLQTGTYLISSQDYKNMIQSKYSICEFLFKKINLLTNDVFFYFPIYNSNLTIVNSICLNILNSTFNDGLSKLIINPETTLLNRAFISPFSFIYDTYNKKYLSCVFDNDIINYSINKEKFDTSITYSCPNIAIRLLYDKINGVTTLYIETSTQYDIRNFDIFLGALPNSTYTSISNNVENEVLLNFSNIYSTILNNGDTLYQHIDYTINQFMPTGNSPSNNSKNITYESNPSLIRGYFYHIPEFIQNDFKLKLKVKKKTSTLLYDYLITFDTISQVKVLGNQFELKKMSYPSVNVGEYVFAVPFIDKVNYDISTPTGLINKKYIDQMLLTNVNYFNSIIPSYKSPTDDIQYRILNSTLIKSDVVTLITRQKYTFDIVLPLQVSITLVVNSDYISVNNIDINVSKTTVSNAIIVFLRSKVGTSISLYPSDIINILADYKFIKSITVRITDSSLPTNNILANGIDTYSISECETKILKANVNNFIDFTPILYWFKYSSVSPDNIDIVYY